ncbi:MAG TPA: DUF3828 domain-containing protein [Blastocatellia bacterium]|nr:DUF3828 domain-containing protein [Blastocatellia bacterium]
MRASLFVKLRVALLMLVVSVVAAPSRAQAVAAPAKTPEAVIREFYKWYVHALNQGKDPLTHARPTMRRYVTARLIAAIDRMAKGPDGLDGDYFIDAQDWDKDWEKNITVSNVVTKQTIATAKVALTGQEMSRHLQLTLKQEAGAWKIDRVKGLDN